MFKAAGNFNAASVSDFAKAVLTSINYSSIGYAVWAGHGYYSFFIGYMTDSRKAGVIVSTLGVAYAFGLNNGTFYFQQI